MGLLDGFKTTQKSRNRDALDSLNQLNVNDEMETVGVRNFVISAALTRDNNYMRISQELEKGNILVLDTTEFGRQKDELESALHRLKTILEQKGGEMARVSDNRILVVPSHFKIVKKNL
ncbi:MAG: cell division protein SepF [Candidatus Micrarchaeota archaeon]